MDKTAQYCFRYLGFRRINFSAETWVENGRLLLSVDSKRKKMGNLFSLDQSTGKDPVSVAAVCQSALADDCSSRRGSERPTTCCTACSVAPPGRGPAEWPLWWASSGWSGSFPGRSCRAPFHPDQRCAYPQSTSSALRCRWSSYTPRGLYWDSNGRNSHTFRRRWRTHPKWRFSGRLCETHRSSAIHPPIQINQSTILSPYVYKQNIRKTYCYTHGT